jgi:hypothetical protein
MFLGQLIVHSLFCVGLTKTGIAHFGLCFMHQSMGTSSKYMLCNVLVCQGLLGKLVIAACLNVNSMCCNPRTKNGKHKYGAGRRYN